MRIHLGNKHRAFTLVGVIIGVMLIVVGVIIVVLLKRALNIKPRQLPDEDKQGYYQPFNPVTDLAYEDMPYQLWDAMNTMGTNWPRINDVYIQGSSWLDVPPQPAYEIVGLGNFDVWMTVGPLNSTNYFKVGAFANGDTNTVYTNAYATMQMKPDLSGVDIKQTDWARTNVSMMFFKAIAQ